MARHPKTTLWMLIKVVLKKRYVRVEKAANGRYIPAVTSPYEPGNYYLRYTLNGKRKWESVGSDLNIALLHVIEKGRRTLAGTLAAAFQPAHDFLSGVLPMNRSLR